MLNPAHILEIAFLLLIAFLIGATIGMLARLIALRLTKPALVPQPETLAVSTSEAAPTLITAPMIDPMAKPPTPVAPAEVLAPDFTEVLKAIAAADGPRMAPMPEFRIPSLAQLPSLEVAKPVAEMAPARVAGETTSGKVIAHPQVAVTPVRAAPQNIGIGAEVIPFPTEKAPMEAITEVAADKMRPAGEADAESTGHTGDVAEPASAPIPSPSIEVAISVVAAEPDGDAGPEVGKDSPADDEAAAMRAIEGNWSPRRRTAGKSRRAAPPEGVADEAVVGEAVPTVAEADEPANEAPGRLAGRPVGLEAPRHGVKDNLTNVIGILPIIETALNSLGVYHFDQVADLSDENVAWLEAHLGIAGRVGREHWREQSRELAVAIATSQKVAAVP